MPTHEFQHRVALLQPDKDWQQQHNVRLLYQSVTMTAALPFCTSTRNVLASHAARAVRLLLQLRGSIAVRAMRVVVHIVGSV